MRAVLDVRLIDMLHVAVSKGASDIHVSPGHPPALRVDGALSFLPGAQLEAVHIETLAADLLGQGIQQRCALGEEATGTWISPEGVTVRVHAYRASTGCNLALRLLHREIPTLSSLGLPRIVRDMVERDRGLLVFTGPTGSGKSTSLAAAVGHINETRARRILTIEDPIEYRHHSHRSIVTQREIGPDTSSFNSALLSALRSDPDVIMVGEMRDQPTMEVVMTAAETGHLILTTLHTGNAAQTIDRIVDAFSAGLQAQVRTQLSQVLVGIVCQRLLPKATGGGRHVAAEILVATDAVRNMIRDGRTQQLRNVMATGRQQGMQTLEHHLTELVSAGHVSHEIAIGVAERASEVAEASKT